jgi:hypothetical protein
VCWRITQWPHPQQAARLPVYVVDDNGSIQQTGYRPDRVTSRKSTRL